MIIMHELLTFLHRKHLTFYTDQYHALYSLQPFFYYSILHAPLLEVKLHAVVFSYAISIQLHNVSLYYLLWLN